MSEPHALRLIPWHIGNKLDITIHAAKAARALRVFLAEEPALTKAQFEDLGIDCRGKEFLLIPDAPDQRFLDGVLDSLRAEGVALICSGGVPCFIDPGAWVVKSLREKGVPIEPLAGASILSTMLSLSGLDWISGPSRGTFLIYRASAGRGGVNASLLETARREDEPLFIFLALAQFRECLEALKPVLGERLVSAFFDLTKVPPSKFPYADRMITLSCRDWLKQAERIPWKDISDVALMIHPRETNG